MTFIGSTSGPTIRPVAAHAVEYHAGEYVRTVVDGLIEPGADREAGGKLAAAILARLVADVRRAAGEGVRW